MNRMLNLLLVVVCFGVLATGWTGNAPAQTRPGASHDNRVYCQNSPGMPARPGPQGYGRTGTNNPFGPECTVQSSPTPRPPTRSRIVELAMVGWISEHPNPFDAVPLAGGGMIGPAQALAFKPEWVVKTYLGLIATANDMPPRNMVAPTFRQKRQYRSLMNARIELTTNAQTNEPLGATLQMADRPDPGWTPPFSLLRFPSAGLSLFLQFFDRCQSAILDQTVYAGEAGQLSGFVNGRHPNSVLQLEPGEQVLVDGVIRFRAGAHTDQVGVCVGSPYHVPWVWNEIALTYANGQYWVRGAASAFPTTWWYVGGALVHCQARLADSSFPVTGGSLGGIGGTIDMARLKAGPALTKGAPTSAPQARDVAVRGPVDRADNTVAQPVGGSGWRRRLDDLSTSVLTPDGSCPPN